MAKAKNQPDDNKIVNVPDAKPSLPVPANNNNNNDDQPLSSANANVEKTKEEKPVKETGKQSTAGKAAIETPSVQNAPVYSTPAEKALINKPLIEDAVAEKVPVKKAPAKKAEVQRPSIPTAPVEKKPVEKTPIKDVSVEIPSVQKTTNKKAQIQKSPVELPVQEAPFEAASVQKPPVEKGLVEKAAEKNIAAEKKGAKPKAEKVKQSTSKPKKLKEPTPLNMEKDNTDKDKVTAEPAIKEAILAGQSQQPEAKPAAKMPAAKVNKEVEEKKMVSAKKTGIKRLTFQLRYHTNPGENVFVTGNTPLLGNNNVDQALALDYLNDEYWAASLDVSNEALIHSFEYKYVVKNDFGIVNSELVSDKHFEAADYSAEEVHLIDAWNFTGLYENTFYTKPFKNVLFRDNETDFTPSQSQKHTHIFKVKAPLLTKNQVVALYGSAPVLGKWETGNPVLLSKKTGEDWWTARVDLSAVIYPLNYKYGIHNIESGEFVQMEGDKNRVLYNGAEPGKVTVLSDGFAVFANNTFKGAGVAIPVFSLRTSESFGVGEFNDVKLLADWAKQVGLKVIQVLPVNDTIATHSWLDSYPYAAISAFALHPMYLHLPAMASAANKAMLQELSGLQQQLNSIEKIDYEKVVNAKLDFVKKIFPSQKEETFGLEAFSGFFDENKHWLVPYAVFSHLRDEYGTPDFTTWPKYNQYNPDEIKDLASTPGTALDSIAIHYFIQYHLHVQLQSATDYANQKGVIVKGDIPIGIYRNSSDAWQEPELYNMDKQAGAPPDDFAIKGQNWGFPTYNWKQMQQDGFAWWKKRFAQMSHYFDAFRIDHILGFFRIWSIPMHAVEGILGNFVPAIPVHKNELEANGIYIDIRRLTSSFINDGVIGEIFGNLYNRVKNDFLYNSGNGHYTIQPYFDTQRKVENYFGQTKDGTDEHRLKFGLFDLISNVILLDAEETNGEQFHFRISMEATSSFRYLDHDLKHKLKALYVNYFFRRQDHYWMEQAMQKLPELKRSTKMLICGEDLGMVPDCVPGVMKQLGILSLEIQRMPKDPKKEFFHPNDAPYLSVVTPSTHDMSTIRGWWEEDRGKTQRFYSDQLGKWGTAPTVCEPELNTAIIIQHLYSPAMWSIFQLQDLFGMDGALRRANHEDERINVPANPRHYWQYRMHINIEDLLQQLHFNDVLRNYITASGR